MAQKIVFSFTFLLYSFVLAAQTLDSTLARYAEQYQPEKAHLHNDKAAYYPGETVWFKVYLMEGLFPATGSKTFYTDWIAEDGRVLQHTVSPLVDGSTNGQFEIPENYSGRVIHVRGYTRWMLNFDSAFLYAKEIRILPRSAAVAKGSQPAAVPSLQFFPEGGEAVVGVSNKIAFKAADQWGRPVRVSGVLQGSNGAVIDSFRSVHDGMGYFYLFPQEGITYTAKWKDEKGNAYQTNLPAIKPSGVSLQVSVSGTKRLLDIRWSANAPANLKRLRLRGVLHSRSAFSTEAVMPNGGSVQKIIPTESLPSGLLTITVFDAANNAVAERVTFINNREYVFQPTLTVQRWGLNRRARNEWQITLPDSMQQASLSVAVTDAAIGSDSSNNIISQLLLAGDIRGRVHNPAYYFSGNSDVVAQHLDLVMLTHGWRRFRWEDVAQGKLPVITYPKDTAYLSLSGQVQGVAKSQLSGTENIILILKGRDSASRMLVVPLRPDGTFIEPGYVFFDTLKVYYQLKSKGLRNAEARFMPNRLPAPNYTGVVKNFLPAYPSRDTTGNAYQAFLAAEALRLQDVQRGRILEAVTVTARKKPPVQVLDEKYTSGLFRSGDGYQFDLINDPIATSRLNIFTYLQGKVPGLQISGGGIGGAPALSWRGSSPQLYLDQMPVDAQMLSGIPVTDVAYVKVFRPPFFGAAGGGAGGAIAVYTRRGGDVQNTPGRGLASNTIMGYTPVREFYSPNYDRFDARNEQRDVRTTLYWNPQVNVTPQQRSVILRFYNNDVTKAFRVIIEGMTPEGYLTHYEQIIE